MTVHTTMNQQTLTPPAKDKTGVLRFLVLLWVYRKTLLIGASAGLLLGVIIALVKPVTYTSSATLVFPAVPQSRLAELTGAATAGDLPSLPLLDGDSWFPNRGRAHRRPPSFCRVVTFAIRSCRNCSFAGPGKPHSSRATKAYFARHLLCRTGKNSELIVGFQDTDPRRAYADRPRIDGRIECRGQIARHRFRPA